MGPLQGITIIEIAGIGPGPFGAMSLAGALHPIGRAGEKPTIPLNLVGDFGGGGLMLAYGMVCGLLESKTSGKGQIVDAAMIDGAANTFHWDDVFDGVDVCYAPVLTMSEVRKHPHHQARNSFLEDDEGVWQPAPRGPRHSPVPGCKSRRMEARLFFEEFFSHFSKIEMTAEPTFIRSNSIHAFKDMPVRLYPRLAGKDSK